MRTHKLRPIYRLSDHSTFSSLLSECKNVQAAATNIVYLAKEHKRVLLAEIKEDVRDICAEDSQMQVRARSTDHSSRALSVHRSVGSDI